MSGVVVKVEVTSEVKEEYDKKSKKKWPKQVRAERERKNRELSRRIRAGEDVDGVGEEERRRIINKFEKRKEQARRKRERVRRIIAGEDVEGVGEEERRNILEQEEARKKRNREGMRGSYAKRVKRVEVRKRKIEAGEEVEGEEEKQKERERREAKAENERKRMERKRRIAAGEEVEGVGEEERMRAIEAMERRRRSNRKSWRKRKAENLEETEKRKEKEKFKRLMKRVTMTEEEREEKRRKIYFGTQARLAKMSKEEREEKRRRFNEKFREWRDSLDEERRRKHFEGMKRSVRKYHEKMKARDPEGYRRRSSEYQRELWERMDEAGKRRRLNLMKMNQQKRRLRRELEGMEEEEIERRVGELDKKLREELAIGPPRRMTRDFRRKMVRDKEDGKEKEEAACSKSVDCSEKVTNLKLEVEAPSPSPIAEVSPAVPETPEEEENEFSEFDDGQVGIPSPESPPPSPAAIPEVVEVTFTCKYCKEPTFSTEEDLKDHLRAEHLKICWKCPKCKEVVLSGKHLAEHFKDKHKKPMEESSSLPTAQIVVRKCHQNKEKGGAGDEGRSKVEFFCLRCPWEGEKSSKIIKIFKSWRELHSHVKLKHRKNYWPCEYCHLLKYSKQSLIVHLMLCRNKPKDKS